MAFADLKARQCITSICEAFCGAVDLQLISAGIDKYGSVAWEVGGRDHLNRYLMFSLTEDEEGKQSLYAEIIGGVDDGSRFAEIIRRGWPFVAERDVPFLADWIFVPMLHLTSAHNELASVKLVIVHSRGRRADQPEDFPRFAPEIGIDEWMEATLPERLAWCWNTVASASRKQLAEHFVLSRRPPADAREHSRNG